MSERRPTREHRTPSGVDAPLAGTEKEAAQTMHTEDVALERESAIRQYGPLVRRVAAQMISRLPANVELDDLVQAGMIGLFDSLSRYEAEQGAQFETFAMQRIRGAMLDELRATDWLPRSVRRSQRAIENAIRGLEHALKRAPLEREVAEAMGMGLSEYRQMLGQARGAQLVYLNELTEHNADEDFLERFAMEEGSEPMQALRDHGFRDALIAAIEELPERERMVMGMYYDEEMNLREIGAVLGVTESRVSQLHSQAVARLRVKLRGWA